MKFTRKQQLYMGILGLFLIGLIMDKTVFSPEEASADLAPAPIPAVEPTSGDALMVASEDGGQASPRVSEQLRTIAHQRRLDFEHVKDAFYPSPKWFSNQPSGGEESPTRRADLFQFQHKLIAMLKMRGESFALIESTQAKGGLVVKQVKVGSELDGFTLISVNEYFAIFLQDGIKAKLVLNEKPKGIDN